MEHIVYDAQEPFSISWLLFVLSCLTRVKNAHDLKKTWLPRNNITEITVWLLNIKKQ